MRPLQLWSHYIVFASGLDCELLRWLHEIARNDCISAYPQSDVMFHPSSLFLTCYCSKGFYISVPDSPWSNVDDPEIVICLVTRLSSYFDGCPRSDECIWTPPWPTPTWTQLSFVWSPRLDMRASRLQFLLLNSTSKFGDWNWPFLDRTWGMHAERTLSDYQTELGRRICL